MDAKDESIRHRGRKVWYVGGKCVGYERPADPKARYRREPTLPEPKERRGDPRLARFLAGGR